MSSDCQVLRHFYKCEGSWLIVTDYVPDATDLSQEQFDSLVAEDGRVAVDDANPCDRCGEPARNRRQILKQAARGEWFGSGQFLYACDHHIHSVEALASTPEAR